MYLAHQTAIPYSFQTHKNHIAQSRTCAVKVALAQVRCLFSIGESDPESTGSENPVHPPAVKGSSCARIYHSVKRARSRAGAIGKPLRRQLPMTGIASCLVPYLEPGKRKNRTAGVKASWGCAPVAIWHEPHQWEQRRGGHTLVNVTIRNRLVRVR